MRLLLSLFLLIGSFYYTEIQAEQVEKKTVCLNMIVKNESSVICRCLQSVKHLIDYWVIFDTGSSDGTQKIIKDFMQDVPGELHESPWVDFAYNRNEVLEIARKKADYSLFIDADEYWVGEHFKLPPLTKDFYYIKVKHGSSSYNRVGLISNHLFWKWEGVLHEALICSQAKNFQTLEGIYNQLTPEGARSKDPNKYQKDAEVLEKAVAKEPNNARYIFYLAQSYKDAGMYEKALQNYQKRITLGGWDEEIFWSMFQIGYLKEALKKPLEDVSNSYFSSFLYRPSRAEPLYQIAFLNRCAENYLKGYKFAKKGLTIPKSNDILFVEPWVYEYGLLLEFSICAYWIKRYTEAWLASQLLLTNTNLPDNVRECVENNLKWINEKIDLVNAKQFSVKKRA
jgi:glycosyltransferase involved in cell wall biosynthesis